MDTIARIIPLPRASRASQLDDFPEILTVRETAAYLRLGLNTTYAYLRDGTIPSQKIGTRYLIHREQIRIWFTQGKVVK